MLKSFGAVYENGLLRPLKPLHLMERQVVSATIDDACLPVNDDDLLDHELMGDLAGEELPEVRLEEVQAALVKIPGSMSAVIAAEREERF